jgi:hypothetical protein
MLFFRCSHSINQEYSHQVVRCFCSFGSRVVHVLSEVNQQLIYLSGITVLHDLGLEVEGVKLARCPGIEVEMSGETWVGTYVAPW